MISVTSTTVSQMLAVFANPVSMYFAGVES